MCEFALKTCPSIREIDHQQYQIPIIFQTPLVLGVMPAKLLGKVGSTSDNNDTSLSKTSACLCCEHSRLTYTYSQIIYAVTVEKFSTLHIVYELIPRMVIFSFCHICVCVCLTWLFIKLRNKPTDCDTRKE